MRSFPSQRWIAIPLFSTLLLIPCFWQSRIQAADLSSHAYNAWLASLIRQGATPGLWIAPQTNNVLFDLILDQLFTSVGAELAQRIAVSIAVLVFGWGAAVFIFRTTAQAAGRNWWLAGPCVAMLAYGFIFQIGFFNFYLSLGLCLWYLAIFWEQNWKIRLIATPLLILAWTAHPFPVVWAIGTAAYVALAQTAERRRALRFRIVLPILGLVTIVVTRFVLTNRFPCNWSLHQVLFITGANQLEIFGAKYVVPFAGLLFIWLSLLRLLIKRLGIAHLLLTIPFQLWLLNGAAVILIPERVLFSGFEINFGYISERLSLMAGLLMCRVLVAVRVPRLAAIGLLLVAAVYFGLLYTDDRGLNTIENQLAAAVSRLPQGSRVITSLPDQSLRSLSVYHDLDRACIGRCFSYANYEPASGLFRIRARPDNGIVLGSVGDDEVAKGTYIVQARDEPLYAIGPCGTDGKSFCSRRLRAGDRTVNAHD